MTNLRSPDFIGIGALKAGTTWIGGNLRKHPGAWQPPFKEIRYFNQVHGPDPNDPYKRQKAVVAKLKRKLAASSEAEFGQTRSAQVLRHMNVAKIDDDWYRAIFGFAPERVICGEISPNYAILPDEGIRHVASLAPDAKIILSTRDPIERAWSQARMMAPKFGHSDTPAKLLDMEGVQRYLFLCSNYPTIFRNWSAHFPPEQIIVVSAEQIETDPDTVLQNLCEHLGLDFAKRSQARSKARIGTGRVRAMPQDWLEEMKPVLRPIYDDPLYETMTVDQAKQLKARYWP